MKRKTCDHAWVNGACVRCGRFDLKSGYWSVLKQVELDRLYKIEDEADRRRPKRIFTLAAAEGTLDSEKIDMNVKKEAPTQPTPTISEQLERLKAAYSRRLDAYDDMVRQRDIAETKCERLDDELRASQKETDRAEMDYTNLYCFVMKAIDDRIAYYQPGKYASQLEFEQLKQNIIDHHNRPQEDVASAGDKLAAEGVLKSTLVLKHPKQGNVEVTLDELADMMLILQHRKV